MIRPITLLCLSDLHLYSWDEDKRQTKKIDALLNFIRYKASDDVCWWPDYIVVAGDVIQYKNGFNIESEYNNATKVLGAILDGLHLKEQEVIIAPGNHDSYCSGITDNLIQDLTNFCEGIQGSKFDFNAGIGDSFKHFHDFYNNYIDKDCYFCPDALSRNNPLCSTFGLKVFESHNVCFLTVNTELTYTPQNSHDSEIMRLVSPLIYPLINEIREKHPQYTVVTVMHRDPRESSWKERNGKNVTIIEDLYECSDVILTGHEHPEKWIGPHMMSNSAQLFKLGSSSMKSRDPGYPVEHYATLIRIDPMGGIVRNKQITWKSGEWQEIEHVGLDAVPLRNKFGKFDKIVPADENGLFTIFSKSYLSSDIDDAILRAFNSIATDSGRQLLKFSHCDSGIINATENCLKENEVLLVLYAEPDGYTVMMNVANNIRKEFMKDIISMRLIVCTAILKVPDSNWNRH